MWGRAYTRETACPGCLQSRRRRASDTVGTVTTLCIHVEEGKCVEGSRADHGLRLRSNWLQVVMAEWPI